LSVEYMSMTDELREEAMRKLSDLSLRAREAGDMKTMYAANRAWNELSQIGRETTPAKPLHWPPRGWTGSRETDQRTLANATAKS
jgi:hypothetical protein